MTHKSSAKVRNALEYDSDSGYIAHRENDRKK